MDIKTQGLLLSSFDAIGDALLVLDADLRIRIVNRTFREWFGVSEDVRGRKCHEVIYGRENPCAVCPTLRSKESRTRETVLKGDNPLGFQGWLEVTSTPLEFDGAVTGYIEHIRDVTRRKEYEERLKEYARAIEGSNEFIFAVDRTHAFTLANKAYLRHRSGTSAGIVGRTVAEVLGSSVYEERIRPKLERAFSGETVEYEMEQADGPERRFMRVRYYPLDGESGMVERVVGVISDITEERIAQQALRERHEIFRSLFLKSRSVMLLIDPESGKIVDANDAAVRYYGYSHAAFKRLVVTDLNILSTEQVREEMERARTESRTHFLFRHRLADGSIRDVEVYSGPVVIQDRQLLYSIVHDVTDRIRAQEELARERAQLEEKVRERTRDLQEANRAKSEFLANMSHEIRTPIAGILGLTEVALERGMPGENRSDLTMIRESAHSLLHIVNDILDLSRIEARRMELAPRNFNLFLLLRRMVDRFRIQAREKGLRLIFRYRRGVPRMIHADPDRIEQIVSNLLSNAIKFTDHGSVVVSVQKASATTNFADLRISVADTGSGIPDSLQSRLFKSFSQLDPSYSKRHRGAGLGLAISRQLAEMMGGTIELRSVDGHGSVFTFSARFFKGRPEAILPAASAAAAPKPRRILLAEDNPVNRVFLRRFLERSGHEVRVVGDGREALKALGENSFDLVLMDIQMPEMDGLETTRVIRSGQAQGIDGTIPIVALTAYAMKGDREKFLDAGMNGYVTKPVDFEELNRVLAALEQRLSEDGIV
jgi:PAS domain S-box-containing protein